MNKLFVNKIKNINKINNNDHENIDNYDWERYLDDNIDLKKAGINTKNQAVKHWLKYGKNEGRNIYKIKSNEINTLINYPQNNTQKNVNIYIYIDNTNNIENKYLEYLKIILKEKNIFETYLINDENFDLKISDDDFLITHNKTDKKFNFNNVIRWFINDFSYTYVYDNNDILLFNTNTNIINLDIKHPDIIDLYDNIEFNNDKIFYINFEENNDIQNINILNEIINKKIYLDNVRFTSPIFNLFNYSYIYENIINVNYNLINSSYELIINIYDNKDICYFKTENNLLKIDIINNILRLEINNRKYELVDINNIKNDNKLKIQFLITQKNIIFNINNIIYTYDNCILVYDNVTEIKIFDNSNIIEFKIYNYLISIYKNNILDIYPKYDIYKLDYPKYIYTNFSSNDNIINNEYNLDVYTIILLLKKDIIFEMKNLQIYSDKDIIYFVHDNKTIYKHIIINEINKIILSSNLNKTIIKINDNIFIINNNLKINSMSIKYSSLLNINIFNHDIIDNVLFNELDIDKTINMFNIFGFIKLNKIFILDNEKLIKAFEYNINKYSKNIIDYIPTAMEYLSIFSELIVNKKIHYILEKIFNDKYYYNGSDCKIYNTDTNWHCDRKTNNLHLKVAIYLDKLDKENGCLCVLPGSHHTSDIYSSILNKKVIPLFQGSGGFPNNFLNNKEIPYLPIENNFGDVVIFNLSLYHAAFNNQYNKKMICMNYAQEYENNNDEEKIECINSDCFIIANKKKNLNLNDKITVLDNNFYKYIKNTRYYEKYFKNLVENNNKLDYYVRKIKSNDMTELNEFVKNCNNTNTYKNNKIIKINNHIY